MAWERPSRFWLSFLCSDKLTFDCLQSRLIADRPSLGVVKCELHPFFYCLCVTIPLTFLLLATVVRQLIGSTLDQKVESSGVVAVNSPDVVEILFDCWNGFGRRHPQAPLLQLIPKLSSRYWPWNRPPSMPRICNLKEFSWQMGLEYDALVHGDLGIISSSSDANAFNCSLFPMFCYIIPIHARINIWEIRVHLTSSRGPSTMQIQVIMDLQAWI